MLLGRVAPLHFAQGRCVLKGSVVVQQSAEGYALGALSAGAQGVGGCVVLQCSGGQGSPFEKGAEAVLRVCAW